MMPASATAPTLQSTKVLVGTVMAGLVVLTGVMGLVLGLDGYPPTWVAWGLGALAVIAFLLDTTVGYRVPAVAPGTPPDRAADLARAAFQTSLFRRLALSEAVAIIGLVLAFAVEPQTAMTVLIGVVLSLALFAWHVWPSDRAIARVQAQLDRDGGRSYLSDVLHGRQPGTGGALLS